MKQPAPRIDQHLLVLTLPRKSQALPWLGAPAYLQELPGNADFDQARY